MKKLKNYILGILAILLYIQVRILQAPLFWRGIPNIDVWSKEKNLVKLHITMITLIWIHILSFVFFGWTGLCTVLGFEMLIAVSSFIHLAVVNYIQKAK